MLSIIKTAIITITLSFISGVLLDHYKNVAPRIICNIGRGRVLRINNKKTKVYFLTIRNISKKTIHDLNINIHAICDSLKIDDAKVTKGLKFDISNEGDIYSVDIPFLSKDDEFRVKVLLEETEGSKNKPSIVLRSPENFKRIDSFQNRYEDINGSSTKKNENILNKYLFGNKKVIISVIGVLLVAFLGVLTAEYYNETRADQKTIYEKPTTNEDNSSNDDSKKDTNTNNTSNTNTNQKTTPIEGKSRSNNNDTNNNNNSSNGTSDSSSRTSSNSEEKKVEENDNNTKVDDNKTPDTQIDNPSDSTNPSNTENGGETNRESTPNNNNNNNSSGSSTDGNTDNSTKSTNPTGTTTP